VLAATSRQINGSTPPSDGSSPKRNELRSWNRDSYSSDSAVQDLKVFLESATEQAVEAIRALLSAVSHDVHLETLRDHITDITSVVHRIVMKSEAFMATTEDSYLQRRGHQVVDNLDICNDRMTMMMERVLGEAGPASRLFKQQLAGIAFEMAKATKDLFQTIESFEAPPSKTPPTPPTYDLL